MKNKYIWIAIFLCSISNASYSVEADSSLPLASMDLEQISKLSSHEVRELVRKMDASEAHSLEESKQALILNIMGVRPNKYIDGSVSAFKLYGPLIGDEHVTTYYFHLKSEVELEEVLNYLPYGSYELLQRRPYRWPSPPEYFRIRSLISNIDLLRDFDGITEIWEPGFNPDGTRSSSSPSEFEDELRIEVLIRDRSERQKGNKEQGYQKALSLFASGIDILVLNIEFENSEYDIDHGKVYYLIKEFVPVDQPFEPFVTSLVSLDPVIFSVSITKEVLEGLYGRDEITNFLPAM